MSLHVVLVEPEIHWNTGNVGRTCLAAGAQLHLVAPLGFELDDARVRRAGLDYWPRVKPRVWPSYATLEPVLATLGEPYFVSPDGQRPFWDVRFPSDRDTVLVFGRESVGLPLAVRERNRERLIRVPMHDPALRSLNLSTCVAVVLFEVLRQQAASRPPAL